MTIFDKFKLIFQRQFFRFSFVFVSFYLIVSVSLSVFFEKNRIDSIIKENSEILIQHILNGDQTSLFRSLDSLSRICGWHDASISDRNGRILVSIPSNLRSGVLKIGSSRMGQEKLVSHDGMEVGVLEFPYLSSTSIFRFIFPTLLYFVFIALMFRGVLKTLNKVIDVFAGNLSQITQMLKVGELNLNNADFGVIHDTLEIQNLVKAAISYNEIQSRSREVKLENDLFSARVELAAQIAHDIRSPLSALNMVTSTLQELPEEKRVMIRNAVQRINDIANGLLKKGRQELADNQLTQEKSKQPTMLVALLDTLLSEKRMQFRDQMGIELSGDLSRGYGLFSNVNPAEFSRAVSNLINNSVEAFDNSKGTIKIEIEKEGPTVQVRVVDNGKGIPPDVLKKLGERGVTHGKGLGTTNISPNSGSGLGIYGAKQILAELGGSLTIDSIVGKGTTVVLSLPTVEAPNWFLNLLFLKPNSKFVSVDDDQTIHQIWKGRLSSAKASEKGIEHLTFSTVESATQWIQTAQPDLEQVRFAVDYEFLGHSESGLDWIERLQIGRRSYLVTSRYEEPHIKTRAVQLGVRIIPKGLAPIIPIHFDGETIHYDAIVIDDDPLVHSTWEFAAKQKGKKIQCFLDYGTFHRASRFISTESPVYIDVSLADGVRGEEIAPLVEMSGFKTIYLATGYDANTIEKPKCVKAVIGKMPQFES